jgi:hypothetical protein
MRRMLFLLALLTAALSLWTGISIFHARSSNASVCLIFYSESDNSYPFKQIDLSNGVRLDVAQPIYNPDLLTTSDGKPVGAGGNAPTRTIN